MKNHRWVLGLEPRSARGTVETVSLETGSEQGKGRLGEEPHRSSVDHTEHRGERGLRKRVRRLDPEGAPAAAIRRVVGLLARAVVGLTDVDRRVGLFEGRVGGEGDGAASVTLRSGRARLPSHEPNRGRGEERDEDAQANLHAGGVWIDPLTSCNVFPSAWIRSFCIAFTEPAASGCG